MNDCYTKVLKKQIFSLLSFANRKKSPVNSRFKHLNSIHHFKPAIQLPFLVIHPN